VEEAGTAAEIVAYEAAAAIPAERIGASKVVTPGG
jgi:hypothetical protein